MDLIEVYIIRTEPPQTVFTLFDDTLFAGIFVNIYRVVLIIFAFKSEFTLWQIPSHTEFGQNLYLITGNTPDSLSNNPLTLALSINRCCIDRSHSTIVGRFYGFYSFVTIRFSPHPSSGSPRAEGDSG